MLLQESGAGGGLGRGAGGPEARWQLAPLHVHICHPFVCKGSSILWSGWLSGIIRTPPVPLGVNPISSAAVRWKVQGQWEGAREKQKGKPQKEQPQGKEKRGAGTRGVIDTFSLFVTIELGAEEKKTHCGKL